MKQKPTDASPLSSKSAKRLRILVPIDFSKPSEHALRSAASFAKHYQGGITLLSVIEADPFSQLAANPLVLKGDELETKLKSELSDWAEKHVGKDHLDAIVVRSGKGFEEIVKAAREWESDLIIIATHGYTGLQRVLLGSTAERVIRYSPCPVLTVHAEQKQGWLLK